SSRIKIGTKFVNVLGDRDSSSGDIIIRLTLHLLPTLGPKPRLIRRYPNVWVKDNLILAHNQLDLRARADPGRSDIESKLE
ncbi:MAG: hypothetical protein ACYCU8_11485, partial [Ferrimicrobium acidiphilum]